MNKLLRPRLLVAGLVVAAVLAALLVYKGSEHAYYAEPILTLKPGDAILRDNRLVYGYFFWGGMPYTAHADRQGRIYIGVQRKHSAGVLVFHPDGTYDREITLEAWPDGRRPTSVHAIDVSPSGNRLWAAVNSRRAQGLPPYPDQECLRVCAYDLEGKPHSLWVLKNSRGLQFDAAGEDGAYLLDDVWNLHTFRIGSANYRSQRFFPASPVFFDDGWIWGVEPNARPQLPLPHYDNSPLPSYPATVWKEKPGGKRLQVCRTTLPGYADLMPFCRDSSRSVYVAVPIRIQGQGLTRGKWVCRISPNGQSEALFNATELVGRRQSAVTFLRVDPKGAVLFAAMGRSSDDPSQYTYRIYKATPTRRWRVWLKKLGID